MCCVYWWGRTPAGGLLACLWYYVLVFGGAIIICKGVAQIGNQSHIWNKNHKYVARFYSVSYHQGAQAPKTLATADGASVPKRHRHLSMPHEWSLYSEPSSIWYLVNFQSVADKWLHHSSGCICAVSTYMRSDIIVYVFKNGSVLPELVCHGRTYFFFLTCGSF